MSETEITKCKLRLGSYMLCCILFIFDILYVNFCSVEGARQHICQKNLFIDKVLTRYDVIFKT